MKKKDGKNITKPTEMKRSCSRNMLSADVNVFVCICIRIEWLLWENSYVNLCVHLKKYQWLQHEFPCYVFWKEVRLFSSPNRQRQEIDIKIFKYSLPQMYVREPSLKYKVNDAAIRSLGNASSI